MNEPTIRPLGQYEPDTRPDGAQLVQQYWPYDGPHTHERTADALTALAALVRYANNATQSAASLGSPPALYDMLGGLHAATAGLDQLTRQLAQAAEWSAVDSSLCHDQQGESAQAAANAAAASLSEAALAADSLAACIDRARQQLAHLYHQQP